MKAVILAAGKGTRMKSNTHKTLIKINGKSILRHNMDSIFNLVDEFIFIVGHKSNEIKKEFGDNYKGKKVTYVIQEQQLGTGHALYQAKDLIDDRFINFNGDDIYSLGDIRECLNYELAALATTVNDPENFGVILERQGYLKDIIEKPKKFISKQISAGLFVFSPEVFDVLKDIIINNKKSQRGESELVDAVKQLALKNKIKVVGVKGYWLPHNKIEDVKKSKELFKIL